MMVNNFDEFDLEINPLTLYPTLCFCIFYFNKHLILEFK